VKNHLFWLLFITVGVVSIGIISKSGNVDIISRDRIMIQSASSLQVEQTLVPTVSPSAVEAETQDSRELPPVGSNAGLVIGASVLVLIIIGGVLGSRRRKKH
jgi:hypothetical protein